MELFHYAINVVYQCSPVNKFDLARLRDSGVSVQVNCVGLQQDGGEQCYLGHAVLSLTSVDPKVKVLPFPLCIYFL